MSSGLPLKRQSRRQRIEHETKAEFLVECVYSFGILYHFVKRHPNKRRNRYMWRDRETDQWEEHLCWLSVGLMVVGLMSALFTAVWMKRNVIEKRKIRLS